MSLLAHATLSAPGLDAEKRALAAQSQHECREAARIQAQTGCTRTEALRLAADPIPESAAECEFGDEEYQWRLRRAGF